MIFLKAILLAVVEGATEFLPVSSTGHLILVEQVLQLSGDPAFNKAFMVVIQLPAILSVLVYFRQDIWPRNQSPTKQRAIMLLWAKTGVAVLPALVFGAALGSVMEEHFFAPVPVAVALLVGGVVLIAVERRRHDISVASVAEITFRTALFIGFFQCLALFPGTSRSAATIIGALLLGVSRPAAAEFSFFLAVPTMIAATAYELMRNGLHFTGEQWMVVGVGSVVSFVTAYMAVAAFMGYVRKHDFTAFGVYRIVLAAVVLVAVAMGLMG